VLKVVIGKLQEPSRDGSPSKPDVSEKHVVGEDGRRKTLRTLKVESPTFGSDLRYVFEKNVAKARSDNKRVTGVADVAPAKH
jgi:hypothetical protein